MIRVGAQRDMPVYFPAFAGTKLYCLVTEAGTGIYNLHLISNEQHQCTEWLYVIFVQLSNVVVVSISRVPALTGSQRSPALLLSSQVVGGLNALKLLIVLNAVCLLNFNDFLY